MALNYLREDDHAEKWILVEKLRLDARCYAEGLTVAAAAARVGPSSSSYKTSSTAIRRS